jgi:hypothetical protein
MVPVSPVFAPLALGGVDRKGKGRERDSRDKQRNGEKKEKDRLGKAKAKAMGAIRGLRGGGDSGGTR